MFLICFSERNISCKKQYINKENKERTKKTNKNMFSFIFEALPNVNMRTSCSQRYFIYWLILPFFRAIFRIYWLI